MQISQPPMVQIGKFQCLSTREFPELFETPLNFNPSGFFRQVMHHLKKVTNFCLYMRYADYKKTLDKYGASKETISIWAPSHTPHIPKITRKWNSFLPEISLSITLMSTPNSLIQISVVFHSISYKWQITWGWIGYQKIS